MNPGDRIESDVRAIALPRGRRVGQPGHDIAREYLRGRLEEIGLKPFTGESFELPFEREGTRFTNLVGVAPGSNRNLPPVLVGAHYDSVINAPCADDNATSVAVALAAAETFAAEPLQRDVVIALFDSEEPPYFLSQSMGSIRFYEDHCTERKFACALIMDLISHDVELCEPKRTGTADEIRQLLFVAGAESGSGLADAVDRAADRLRADGLRVVATRNDYIRALFGGDMSDYSIFRQNKKPYLFLSCGQGRHYHSMTDSLDQPDWINFDKTRRVHELVVNLLQEVDRLEANRTRTGSAPVNTLDVEIRTIRQALGGLFMETLRRAGLQTLETRDDLNRLIASLLGDLEV